MNYSDEQIKFIRDNYHKLNALQLSQKSNLSVNDIQNISEGLGLKLKPLTKITAIDQYFSYLCCIWLLYLNMLMPIASIKNMGHFNKMTAAGSLVIFGLFFLKAMLTKTINIKNSPFDLFILLSMLAITIPITLTDNPHLYMTNLFFLLTCILSFAIFHNGIINEHQYFFSYLFYFSCPLSITFLLLYHIKLSESFLFFTYLFPYAGIIVYTIFKQKAVSGYLIAVLFAWVQYMLTSISITLTLFSLFALLFTYAYIIILKHKKGGTYVKSKHLWIQIFVSLALYLILKMVNPLDQITPSLLPDIPFSLNIHWIQKLLTACIFFWLIITWLKIQKTADCLSEGLNLIPILFQILFLSLSFLFINVPVFIFFYLCITLTQLAQLFYYYHKDKGFYQRQVQIYQLPAGCIGFSLISAGLYLIFFIGIK